MGGYKSLLVYRLSVTISDFNQIFCDRWIDRKSRTYDQMIQASRSGKQNIAEASKELSTSSDMLLNSVARSSFTELAEDYDSFMERVNIMTDETNPNNLTDDQDKIAFKYYSNSRGASTDLKQRGERLAALKEAIL